MVSVFNIGYTTNICTLALRESPRKRNLVDQPNPVTITRMSRHPNTDSLRSQIVAALLPVLARKGYAKATVVEIARQAGLAPGLIHYHFANKREILVSLVLSMVEYANARSEQAAGGSADPLARLRAHIDSRLGLGDGADADMAAAWVMIGAEAVREPEVRAVYQQAIADELATLTQLLGECLGHAGRDKSTARQLASGLIAMMEGAFQLASAAGEVMPKGYAANAAWNCARLGIEAAGPARRRRPS
jgi:TetR/AcrR family transcriptional repressor of bet genes